MSYLKEFPDFPRADMPAMPDGWKDESWHNDTCPTFVCGDVAGFRAQLWIDYADASKRKHEGGARFALHVYGPAHSEPLRVAYDGDDWADCAAVMVAERLAVAFAKRLYREMSPAHWMDMRLDNRNNGGTGVCASHDFRDANMDMHAAFMEVTSRDPLESSEEADTELWNSAWSAAMVYLTSDEEGARFDAWRASGRYVGSLEEAGQEMGGTDSPGMIYSHGFIEEAGALANRWRVACGNVESSFDDLADAEWHLWTVFAARESE